MRNVPSAGALPTNRSVFFERCLVYLLGLLSAQNIFYILRLTSTCFNVILIVGLIAAVYCLLHMPDNRQTLRVLFDFGMQGYLATILLSSISFLAVLRQYDRLPYRSYLNGLLYLPFFLGLYYAVYALRAHKEWLLRGIVHGFVLNLIFSVVQLVFFERGPGFTFFRELFPQGGFFLSLQWSNSMGYADRSNLIFFYRAQGLFLECSHLLAFTSLFGLFAFSRMNKLLRWPLFALMLYLYTISLSGNLLIVLAVFAVYAVLRLCVRQRKDKPFDPNAKRRAVLKIVGTAVLLIAVLLLLYVFSDRLRGLLDDFFASLQTSSLLDSDNAPRLAKITTSIDAILQKPFGVGNNMAGVYLNMIYGETYRATASAPLTLLLENGPLGFFFYYLFLLHPFIRLLRLPLNRDRAILLAGFIGLFLIQVGNGTLNTEYIWIFLALARAEITEAEGHLPDDRKRGVFRSRRARAEEKAIPIP